MRIKQSVCYPMMQPLPVDLAEFIETVAMIGFPAVELWKPDADFDDLVALTQKFHLRIASITGHDSLPVGLNDRGQHERICGELRSSIDLAARLNIPGLICFSGNRLPGQSEEDAIQACVEGFRKIAPYAEEKGVNLNLELLNSLVDHPGYQCDHAAWGLEVVKTVNSPRVKLLYDIYHMQIMEGNLIQTITENIQWIGHFHTAGVPGRHEIDDTQEINYRGLCKAIAETGYDLYMGHEFRPTRDHFATLQEAFIICDQG
ncbi:MAG TPA: TIM barrel protein [Anaerolineaceae bacterium]